METQEFVFSGAETLVVVTKWQHFKTPNLEVIIEELGDAVIFDGRNLFEPRQLAKQGMT